MKLSMKLGITGPNYYFLPSDLNGLQLWFDGSETSTITEVAGKVSQWDDKSGNARHAVQAVSGEQPSTGTVTINGKNTIEANNGKALDIDLSFLLNTDYTAFFVEEVTGAFENQHILMGADTGGSGPKIRYDDSTVFRFSSGANFTSYAPGGGFATNTPRLWSGKVISTSIELFLNGVSVSSNTFSSYVTTQSLGLLGNDGGWWAHKGGMGEVVIFDRALLDSEMTLVSNYLLNKWGI